MLAFFVAKNLWTAYASGGSPGILIHPQKLFLEISIFFQESFFTLEYSTYICNVNQLNNNNYEKGNDNGTKSKKGRSEQGVQSSQKS